MTNFVSSVCDSTKCARLNNVIQSLACFVSCTTPDKTVQDYGIIEYSGPINVGTVITGTRVPRKTGTPIIVSDTYLGTIDESGRLIVKNDTSVRTSWSTESKFTDISYVLYNCTNDSSRYYNCNQISTVSNTTCSTYDGWDVCTTCTTECYSISERCAWGRAYEANEYEEGTQITWNSYVLDDGLRYCFIYNTEEAGGHTCWCGESPVLASFDNGKTCVSDSMPNQIFVCGYHICNTEDTVAIQMTATHCITTVMTRCTRRLGCIDICERYI